VDPLLSLEVQRAQQALDWLKEGVDPALVNDVSRAQLALERLQSQLANAQIVAPVGGEVLSLSIYPGRPVEAFKTAIVIADPSDIQVSANLSDEQLKKMTEGQRATVVLNTDSDRTWSGAVLRMPYPYGSANNARSGAEIDNSTRISLEGDVGELQLGDLVHVSIVLEEKDNALWLPPAAIRTFQDRVFVIVQDGDRQRRVDVELGIEGWDQVEILKGLEQGQVVLAP
jgi:multidrug efflux pump subunit AcrA (membrane-fusion protein)